MAESSPTTDDQIAPRTQCGTDAAQEGQRIGMLHRAIQERGVEGGMGKRRHRLFARLHGHVEPAVVAKARIGPAAVDDAENLPPCVARGEHVADGTLAVGIERVRLGLRPSKRPSSVRETSWHSSQRVIRERPTTKR